ncbi:MAG TPA: alanine--glyoxylate aminotransferase family protein [Candidatus Rubrimentiphilum sp.]|nr:alanine--glyoxylate aminotransferase family protein [Candidatus Rubrimentiphilum sp.]
MRQLLFIPGPVTVSERVLAAMNRPLIDHRGPEFSELVERINARLRPIFGMEEGEIVLLGSSGTGGLEAAIANAFSPGDTLLAAPMGAFGERMIAIARKYGMNVDALEARPGFAVDPREFARRLNDDTDRRYRGILLTHNETSTGVQSNMGELAAIARAHGALTVVDSVSGLGATDFRMDEWGYDIVAGASQKVLAAPPGVAMLAISPRAWNAIEASKTPRFYFDLVKAREFARQGQMPWTSPVSTMFALDAALEHYEREGAPATYRRLAMYAEAIRAAFTVLGLEVFSQPGAHSVTVVTAKIPAGVDAAGLLRGLREDRGVTLAGGQLDLKGKIVRMGTMGDISQTDVLAAIGAIEIALLGYDVPVRVGEAGKAALSVFLNAGGATDGDAQRSSAQMDAQTTGTSR